MQKAILSLSLIFTSIAYAHHVRIMEGSSPVVLLSEVDKSKVVSNLPQYSQESSTTIIPKSQPISKPVSNTPTSTQVHASVPVQIPPPPIAKGKYIDGTYAGKVADAYYGNVQVRVTIFSGEITDVEFLDYPHSRQTSERINSRAMPFLISEAIAIQDSNVDTVSGASFTSEAYRESLSSALAKAKA